MTTIVIALSNKLAAVPPQPGHAARIGFIIAVLLICLLSMMVIIESFADRRLAKWVHDFDFAVVPLLLILGVLIVIELAQLLHIL